MFKHNPSNISAVTSRLLKALKVKVNFSSLTEQLELHPEYPSLLSIIDCCNEYGVSSDCFLIPREEYNVQDLLFPFIAHFGSEEKFVLVNYIADSIVDFTDENISHNKLTEHEFLNRWSGIALHSYKREVYGEPFYFQNRIKYTLQSLRLPVLFICLAIMIYLFIPNASSNLPLLLISIIKIAGVLTTSLLLAQSVDLNNPFINSVCKIGGKSGCNEILKSQASKLTPWLSWSEVGFFYYTISFLLLLINPANASMLAWINLFCLPFSLYSIVYQYKNKSWCVLCCAVQGLLAAEFLTNLLGDNFRYTGSYSNYLIIALSMTGPILFWSFVKPFIVGSAKVPYLNFQLNTFKYNSKIFAQSLSAQPLYIINDDLSSINLGNIDASTVITLVSHPFCTSCISAHQTLTNWLKVRKDLKVKIVFATSNKDNDDGTMVARHVAALSLQEDPLLTELALNHWYGLKEKKYSHWASQYPVDSLNDMNVVTKKQKDWCDELDINFTPTVFINGFSLPYPYRLEDLKYLVG